MQTGDLAVKEGANRKMVGPSGPARDSLVHPPLSDGIACDRVHSLEGIEVQSRCIILPAGGANNADGGSPKQIHLVSLAAAFGHDPAQNLTSDRARGKHDKERMSPHDQSSKRAME